MSAESDWFKSSFSAQGNCVEVKMEPDAIQVRHTKDRSGPTLKFTASEWTAFVRGVCAGEFDAA